MAVRIRLKRTGTRNCACFRIVVCDARSSRDGRAIETIGFYDPRQNDEKVNVERADYWVSNGAQPSETVADIIKRAKEGKSKTPAQKAEKEAVKKAAADKVAAEKAKKEAEEKAKQKAEEKAAADKAAAEAEAAAAEEAKTEEAAEEPKAEEAVEEKAEVAK
jgi:small subunit ribosomal protein S16